MLIRLIFLIIGLVAAYYAITYAMSAINVLDSTFASGLSLEFGLTALVWGVAAVFCLRRVI